MRSQQVKVRKMIGLIDVYKSKIEHYDELIIKYKQDKKPDSKDFIQGMRKQLIVCIKDLETILKINDMNWISIKLKMPPENIEVSVKFKNGKIIKGRNEKGFMVFNPNDLTFEMASSKPIEWQQ